MGDLVELGDELRLETHGELDAARDEWMRLAERAPNVFGTWEWASTWWRHFGRGAKPLVTVCRRAAEPMAILPLCLAKERGVRTIRFIGHAVGTQLGPVCDPADAAEAARALDLALRAAPRWDLFVANDLPGEQRWQELLGARVLRRTPSPVVNIAGNWDQFLRTRSANFRQKARNFERRLEREHDLRYRLADDPDRLNADLDVLFALHAKRWGNAASSLFAPLQGFHREFATLALERGWLRLWLLELDGTAAAAQYGFRIGPTEWLYQTARDPEWERHSLGFVMLAHAMHVAADGGVFEYRLGRGAAWYKDRFATHDPGVDTVALVRTPRGRAALAAAQLREKLRARLATLRG